MQQDLPPPAASSAASFPGNTSACHDCRHSLDETRECRRGMHHNSQMHAAWSSGQAAGMEIDQDPSSESTHGDNKRPATSPRTGRPNPNLARDPIIVFFPWRGSRTGGPPPARQNRRPAVSAFKQRGDAAARGVLSDRGGRDRSRRRNLHCKQLVGAGPGPQEARSGKLTAVETGREPRRRGTGRVRKPLRAGGHHACHQQQP